VVAEQLRGVVMSPNADEEAETQAGRANDGTDIVVSDATQLAALSSIRTSGPSRRFYDRKPAERLIHTQALLALARRLVDVLWALLRDGREFTPEMPTPVTAAV
jgi:hypothetical protein